MQPDLTGPATLIGIGLFLMILSLLWSLREGKLDRRLLVTSLVFAVLAFASIWFVSRLDVIAACLAVASFALMWATFKKLREGRR